MFGVCKRLQTSSPYLSISVVVTKLPARIVEHIVCAAAKTVALQDSSILREVLKNFTASRYTVLKSYED